MKTLSLKQFSAITVACAALSFVSLSKVEAQTYTAPQGYDMSTVAGGAGQATESMAATGDYGTRSFKSGQSPFELKSHQTGVTQKGLGSITTGLGHLQLPYAGQGGLAPVFGFGQQVIMPPRYTTVMDDPITIIRGNTMTSVVPSTGDVYSRIGNVRTGMTFDGNGNPSIKVDNGNGVGGSYGSNGISIGGGLLSGAGNHNSGF